MVEIADREDRWRDRCEQLEAALAAARAAAASTQEESTRALAAARARVLVLEGLARYVARAAKEGFATARAAGSAIKAAFADHAEELANVNEAAGTLLTASATAIAAQTDHEAAVRAQEAGREILAVRREAAGLLQSATDREGELMSHIADLRVALDATEQAAGEREMRTLGYKRTSAGRVHVGGGGRGAGGGGG